MASENPTTVTQPPPPPPGLGKWNRSKRRLKLQQEPHRKKKITKEERREKYTAIAKERQVKKQQKDVMCFRCRQKGHSIQYCTNEAAVVADAETENGESQNNGTPGSCIESETTNKKSKKVKNQLTVCCYKCGSTEHNLASCPEVEDEKNSKKTKNQATVQVPQQQLPYATCFICQQRGHIALQCPQNQHGIYVQGNGQCKFCGSKYHRGSHCPDKSSHTKRTDKNKGFEEETFDTSDLLDDTTVTNDNATTKTKSADPQPRKKRVVVF
jgi:zinc finger CCHC domain-containing protein 9